MCQNNGVIVGLFLLKLIVLIFIPALLIYFKIRKFDNYLNIIKIEIGLILLLIIISIVASTCTVNSSFFNIGRLGMNNENNNESVKEPNDSSIVEEVYSSDKYTTKANKKVYYFNNYQEPLSDVKIKCGGKDLYLKNIGNNITAVATLVSTELSQNIDPIQILKLSVENEIMDCNEGIDTDALLSIVSQKYKIKFREVDGAEAISHVNSGNIVMANITNKMTNKNISCGPSSIILYRVNNEGKINILNPSDRRYDYICPDNSIGYGTIIKSNTSEEQWDSYDIFSLVTRYIIVER